MLKKFHTAVLALLSLFSLTGCSTAASEGTNAQETHTAAETVQTQESVMRVIVVFKEGVTYNEAVEAAAAYGMKVSIYYKTLSARSNKINMALESSSLQAEEMVRLLQNDPRVEALSIDYQRKPMQ